MYDYRGWSEGQRREAIQQRRQFGHPLHKPPHSNLGEGWYLISAATFEHVAHFWSDAEKSALALRLSAAIAKADVPLAGWVVLPNHYHLLLHVGHPRVAGKAIGPVHGRSSHYVNQRDRAMGRQVWYKYTDRKVRSERHFWTCLHYIVMNPVKHGHATEPAEWQWSCYHELRAEHGETWLEELRREYPLLEFGAGWDP